MTFLPGIAWTHLNAPDLQTAKTSASTNMVTLADDHLISSTFLIPVEGVKVYFIFHILLLHFGFWLNNDGCNTSCFVVHLRLCLRNFKTFQGTECRYVLLRKLLEVKVSVLYFYHDCIFPSFCNYFPNYGKSSHISWSLLTLVFPQLSPVSLCCLMDNH